MVHALKRNNFATWVGMALVLASVLLAGACSGTATLKTGDAPPIADRYPTAPPLAGDAPVGYWWCVVEFDVDAMRTSNTSPGPHGVQCRNGVALGAFTSARYADGVEFRPDGSGHDLEINEVGDDRIPATSFRVEGSPLLFSRDRELRWRILEDGRLHIQTQRNQYLDVEVVTADVLRISASNRLPDLMIRVGSPAAKRMQAFAACVKENRRKPLFDVVDCGDPIGPS